jgi:hypothetical protein
MILFDRQPAIQTTAFFELINNGFIQNNVPPVVANNCTRTWTKIVHTKRIEKDALEL